MSFFENGNGGGGIGGGNGGGNGCSGGSFKQLRIIKKFNKI
jgi:hypothetical protein